ncbi:hypothetical protein, partial [Gordonibacter pamelaeae]|uniref:hypothetical protein n=1 Tax=Gordonibacter pamelaeae TaxID=471189 RepID=UPI00242E2556
YHTKISIRPVQHALLLIHPTSFEPISTKLESSVSGYPSQEKSRVFPCCKLGKSPWKIRLALRSAQPGK